MSKTHTCIVSIILFTYVSIYSVNMGDFFNPLGPLVNRALTKIDDLIQMDNLSKLEEGTNNIIHKLIKKTQSKKIEFLGQYTDLEKYLEYFKYASKILKDYPEDDITYFYLPEAMPEDVIKQIYLFAQTIHFIKCVDPASQEEITATYCNKLCDYEDLDELERLSLYLDCTELHDICIIAKKIKMLKIEQDKIQTQQYAPPYIPHSGLCDMNI